MQIWLSVLPPRSLILFGLQHVLVMAASPITAVFLVAQTLGFDTALTVSVISATFLVCGLGSILQSFGPQGFGARLPFIMVPGGAPIAIFLAIAVQADVQTAVGAVLLTAIFYFAALPVFRRLLRYFPPIVVGTMLLLVSVTVCGEENLLHFAPDFHRQLSRIPLDGHQIVELQVFNVAASGRPLGNPRHSGVLPEVPQGARGWFARFI